MGFAVPDIGPWNTTSPFCVWEFSTNTASNLTLVEPYPRNRRERRMMQAIGRQHMIARAEKIWGPMPVYRPAKWISRFWSLFERETPRARRTAPSRQLSGHMPSGRRRRIRACSRRWSAIRA